jgi:uncharacterized membrane protein
MYSKIKLFGHPVHPMFVAFPIAFYTATFLCYATYLSVDDPFWLRAALISNAAGVITALLAAVPGILDWWLGIPKDSAAKKRGALHGGLNVGALVFFVINLFVLRGAMANPADAGFSPILLSGLGLILTVVAGWHGYELISKHKVGVDLSPEQERLERSREERRAA